MIGQVELSSHPSKVYRMLSKVAAPPRDAKRKKMFPLIQTHKNSANLQVEMKLKDPCSTFRDDENPIRGILCVSEAVWTCIFLKMFAWTVRVNIDLLVDILDNLSLLLVHICSPCCQDLIESRKYLLLVSINCQPGVKATAVLPLNIFIHSIEVRKHSQWKLSISTATYLHAKSANANNAEKNPILKFAIYSLHRA